MSSPSCRVSFTYFQVPLDVIRQRMGDDGVPVRYEFRLIQWHVAGAFEAAGEQQFDDTLHVFAPLLGLVEVAPVGVDRVVGFFV